MSKKNKATDETQIRKMIDDWADALRNKNAEACSHICVTPCSFFPRSPATLRGSDADGLDAWFGTWQGPIGYEIRGLSVTVGDHVAFSHSLNRFTERPVARRAISGFDTRSASGRSATNGKIAHEHESEPFYMDGSFKAAVDLKP
jgi:PhnB protein